MNFKVWKKGEKFPMVEKTARVKFDYVELAGITPSIERDVLLRNLDCLTEEGQLTNAGVLFFAKSTEFVLMQATVVCVLYKGSEKLHILDKKDFSGNLIENIENAVLFVQRHTNTAYRIEYLRREEIPEVALRESIIGMKQRPRPSGNGNPCGWSGSNPP